MDNKRNIIEWITEKFNIISNICSNKSIVKKYVKNIEPLMSALLKKPQYKSDNFDLISDYYNYSFSKKEIKQALKQMLDSNNDETIKTALVYTGLFSEKELDAEVKKIFSKADSIKNPEIKYFALISLILNDSNDIHGYVRNNYEYSLEKEELMPFIYLYIQKNLDDFSSTELSCLFNQTLLHMSVFSHFPEIIKKAFTNITDKTRAVDLLIRYGNIKTAAELYMKNSWNADLEILNQVHFRDIESFINYCSLFACWSSNEEYMQKMLKLYENLTTFSIPDVCLAAGLSYKPDNEDIIIAMNKCPKQIPFALPGIYFNSDFLNKIISVIDYNKKEELISLYAVKTLKNKYHRLIEIAVFSRLFKECSKCLLELFLKLYYIVHGKEFELPRDFKKIKKSKQACINFFHHEFKGFFNKNFQISNKEETIEDGLIFLLDQNNDDFEISSHIIDIIKNIKYPKDVVIKDIKTIFTEKNQINIANLEKILMLDSEIIKKQLAKILNKLDMDSVEKILPEIIFEKEYDFTDKNVNLNFKKNSSLTITFADEEPPAETFCLNTDTLTFLSQKFPENDVIKGFLKEDATSKTKKH
ncbi:MAG: hypothetical protein RBR08_14915 [Desulforegulaceae bacterium]|nr:hypothetical protein [Desulforegulaceae bacterium]